LLLVLASTVILGSEFRDTHDHVFCITALGVVQPLSGRRKENLNPQYMSYSSVTTQKIQRSSRKSATTKTEENSNLLPRGGGEEEGEEGEGREREGG
jgi:hypothetical protein